MIVQFIYLGKSGEIPVVVDEVTVREGIRRTSGYLSDRYSEFVSSNPNIFAPYLTHEEVLMLLHDEESISYFLSLYIDGWDDAISKGSIIRIANP